MGLFDKKYCDVCGDKIGLLGNRKLEDGNLCKNCAKKLSPWFDERRHSTVDMIKKQLAYREENQSKAAAFNITRTFGKGSTKLYVDDNARKFAVHRGNDFASGNPDILDFSQAVGCDLEISEDRDEMTRTVDGRTESYNPPRYEYSYSFKVTINVNHPYFNQMNFDLKGSAVSTGEQRMNGGAVNSAWRISSIATSFLNQRNIDEYNELVQTGNELKAMIDSWKNGGVEPFAGQQTGGSAGEVRFGSANPVPYIENFGGKNIPLEVNYFGLAGVSVLNPATVQNYNGMEALKPVLQNDLCIAVNEVLSLYSAQQVRTVMLPAKSAEISALVKSKLDNKWAVQYGVALQEVKMENISLTSESQQRHNVFINMAMGGQNQYPVQEMNQQYQQPAQQYQQPVQTDGWMCPNCGAHNTGKFCTSCGAKR